MSVVRRRRVPLVLPPPKNPPTEAICSRACRPAVRCPSVVGRSTPILRDARSVYLVDVFQWNSTQHKYSTCEWISRSQGTQGQRSKVKVTTRPNALMAEACISTVWLRNSLVFLVDFILITFTQVVLHLSLYSVLLYSFYFTKPW